MKNALTKPFLALSLGIGLLTTTVSCAVLASSNPFTVQGELPAHTGITFAASYYPENDQSSACSYKDLSSGSSELRGGTVDTEVPIKNEAQHYQVSIPTQTYAKRCKLLLTGVSVVVANDQNDNDRQTDQTGFIGIVDKTPLPATKEHPANFEINCSWSFSISPRIGRPNTDILKMMNCTVAKNQYVSRSISLSDLTNQSMVLNISFNKDEKPSCEKCWIKVAKGWQSCVDKWGGDEGLCSNNPKIKTFKYQGKTCSVYPTCNE